MRASFMPLALGSVHRLGRRTAQVGVRREAIAVVRSRPETHRDKYRHVGEQSVDALV